MKNAANSLSCYAEGESNGRNSEIWGLHGEKSFSKLH